MNKLLRRGIYKGVFIGGWYEISLDADGDGTDEMMAFGYSGDSTNGLDSLVMTDMFNGIMDDLNPVLLALPKRNMITE